MMTSAFHPASIQLLRLQSYARQVEADFETNQHGEEDPKRKGTLANNGV